MKYVRLALLFSLAFPGPARAQEKSARRPAASAVAAALQNDLGRPSDDETVTCKELATQPIKWGLLILGSELDLATAESKAREISQKTGLRFSTEGYALDPKTKRATFERMDEGGSYRPRTSLCKEGDECITIERSSGYTTLTPKLFIIVGAVLAESPPESLSKLRAVAPDAFVKYSTVQGDPGGYGATSACVDWDVIVLARTKSFEHAEAIAKAVSTQTGIRYAERTPRASTDDWYDGRKGPFPNITVEADNAYNELGESPYFLVIGGAFDRTERTSLRLFKAYEKVVPNAYRLKHARHVCGA